jgi:hypothetical protein
MLVSSDDGFCTFSGGWTKNLVIFLSHQLQLVLVTPAFVSLNAFTSLALS